MSFLKFISYHWHLFDVLIEILKEGTNEPVHVSRLRHLQTDCKKHSNHDWPNSKCKRRRRSVLSSSLVIKDPLVSLYKTSSMISPRAQWYKLLKVKGKCYFKISGVWKWVSGGVAGTSLELALYISWSWVMRDVGWSNSWRVWVRERSWDCPS